MKVELVEYWIFDPKEGDECILTVKGSGEVLRRERWVHGESPAMVTSPLQRASECLVFAHRHTKASSAEVEEMRLLPPR